MGVRTRVAQAGQGGWEQGWGGQGGPKRPEGMDIPDVCPGLLTAEEVTENLGGLGAWLGGACLAPGLHPQHRKK